MSWNHVQAETTYVSAANQNKYKGMVPVLPTHRSQTFHPDQISNVSNERVDVNWVGSFDYSVILPERPFQRAPHTGTVPSGVVPRLPPPPKSLKVNNSQRMGRLDNQGRFDLHKSVHDLRQAGSAGKQALELPSSSLSDRRSLNLSALDIRVPIKPEQCEMGYESRNQNNRSANIQVPDYREFAIVQNRQEVMSNGTGFSTSSTAAHTIKQTNGEMSFLHDELAQLKLELAAMKDPMKEHEEWLRYQSGQIRELKELQKQLQSNMVVNNKQPEKKAEPFTPLPLSPVAYKVSIPDSPKSPRPILGPKPTLKSLPFKVLPKPTQIRISLSNLPDTSSAVPKVKTIGIQHTNQRNTNTDQRKETLVPSATTVQGDDKPISLGYVKVKRISQIFEVNAVDLKEVEKTTHRRSNFNYDAKPKNGTIRKLLPSLLQSIQASEEAKISSLSSQSKFLPKPDALKSVSEKPIFTNAQQPSQLSNSGRLPIKKVTPSFLEPTSLSNESPSTTPSNVQALPDMALTLSNGPHVSPKSSTLSNVPPLSQKPSIPSYAPPVAHKPSRTSCVPPQSQKTISNVLPSPVPSLEPTKLASTLSPKITVVRKPPFIKPTAVIPKDPPTPASSKFELIPPSSKAKALPNVPAASLKPKELISGPMSSSRPLTTEAMSSSNLVPSKELQTKPSPIKQFTSTEQHRYENVLDEFKMPFSTVMEPGSKSSQHILTTEDSSFQNHRYSNISDESDESDEIDFPHIPELTHEPASPLTPPIDNPMVGQHFPTLSLHMKNYSHQSPNTAQLQNELPPNHINLSVASNSPIISSLHSTTSKQSSTHAIILRPTTPPPPPIQSPSIPQNSISHPPPPPPPIQSLSPSPSVTNEIPTSSPNKLVLGTAHVLLSSQTSTRSASLDIAQNNVSEKSGSTPSLSLPGSPVSSTGSVSKTDLMEQIRQFKQSGKSLKRASLDTNESNGTPTRARKNSMHDALQTRFQAFCEYESESSEEEAVNEDEDDWAD